MVNALAATDRDPAATAATRRIHPRRLADDGACLRGMLASDAMARLQEACVAFPAQVAYTLHFSRDEAGRAQVRGQACAAGVTLTCQRCLGEMQVDLHADFALEVVGDEDDEVRAEGHEPLVAADTVALAEVLETELLLVLPFAPVHEAEPCLIDERYAADGESAPERPSPFAVLKDLVSG